MMNLDDVLRGSALWAVQNVDALSGLPDMADASVNCVVTSPPYFHKRKYGVTTTFSDGWVGELGQEPTPDLFVDHLVGIFAPLQRVLHSTGTLWINLGDSRAGAGRSNHLNTGGRKNDNGGKEHYTPAGCYQQTELIGVPWLFAFAMRQAGWGLFDHITWAKRAPMPESVKRRTTYATEDIFMFGKSNRYYYDQAAIAEPIAAATTTRNASPRPRSTHKHALGGLLHTSETMPSHFEDMAGGDSTRNPWSYWLIDDEPTDTLWHLGPAPLEEEHYAAYPPEIARRCILAGCPADGIVLDPFAGSGTTLMVARRLGRRAVGLELNPEYCEIARRRVLADNPMFNANDPENMALPVSKPRKKRAPKHDQMIMPF